MLGSAYFPPAVPGRRNLLSAAVAVTQADVLGGDYAPDNPLAWVNGLSFVSDSCDALDPMGIMCLGSPTDKGTPDNPGAVDVSAFLTFGADRCSSLDFNRQREARARRNLLATESWQIEREFFDGIATTSLTPDAPNPYLTDGVTAATVGSGSLAPISALGELEGELLDCLHGQRGMIHASPDLVERWQSGGALRVEGNTILTVLDTIVVPGSGYSGAGPDGTPAATGTTWAYGTGLVYLLQGTIDDPAAGNAAAHVDRQHNTTTVIVERPNLLLFAPCCVKAVHATLP